jgi:hypothetical protein
VRYSPGARRRLDNISGQQVIQEVLIDRDAKTFI